MRSGCRIWLILFSIERINPALPAQSELALKIPQGVQAQTFSQLWKRQRRRSAINGTGSHAELVQRYSLILG
jgi:hypothetical protein